jgi:hypothetical protein
MRYLHFAVVMNILWIAYAQTTVASNQAELEDAYIKHFGSEYTVRIRGTKSQYPLHALQLFDV